MSQQLKQFVLQQVDMDEAAWQDMESCLTYHSIKRKDHFLKEGQICRQVGFILKGYVRLYYLDNGVEITKDFNFENYFCGSYASFSMQQPSRFYVVAMEDVELCALNREDVYRLFDQYPAMQKLGRIWMEKMFIRKELREASFLLDTAEQRYEDLLRQEDQVLQRVPLKYLASYLGMSAETLSRIRSQASRKPGS